MKMKVTTWAAVDQCFDEPLLEAEPPEYDTREEATDAAKESADEVGGAFFVVRITREVVGSRTSRRRK